MRQFFSYFCSGPPIVLLGGIVVCFPTVYSQSPPQTVPPTVLRTLDERFPGWMWSPVLPPDTLYVHDAAKTPSIQYYKNNISGDFDGNGKTNFAVKIIFGQPVRREYIVALMWVGRSFMPHTLETCDSSEALGNSLELLKKGEKGYNVWSEQELTYDHDSIFLNLQDKAGYTYVYFTWGFGRFLSSD